MEKSDPCKGRAATSSVRIMPKLVGSGLMSIVSIAIALLIGELAVRTLYPQQLGIWTYTRDGLTLHLPNMSQHSQRFGYDIKTNSLGMRDREHKIKKAESVFRILVLGDSFMEALQVKFEDSFASLLEIRLRNEVGRSVEVINASVSGWGTDDELTYLMREGLKMDPDLIIVAMTLHNDVNDNLLEEYHSFQGGRLYQRPVSLVPWPSFALLKVKEWLAANSHMYQVFLRANRINWASAEAKNLDSHVIDLLRRIPTKRMEFGWSMTQQLFEKIMVAGRSNNATVVVVLLPLYVQVYPDGLGAVLKTFNLREEEIDRLKPQELMMNFGRTIKLPVLDLLPIFWDAKARCNCSLYVEGDGHWNEEGHKVAAGGVADKILTNGWVPSN